MKIPISIMIIYIALNAISKSWATEVYVKPVKSGVVKCSGDIIQECSITGITIIDKNGVNSNNFRALLVNGNEAKGIGRSNVLDVDIIDQHSIKVRGSLETGIQKNILRFEAITTTIDGKYAIAVTGFNQTQNPDNDLDKIGKIIAWKTADPNSSEFSPTLSETDLRSQFKEALSKHFNCPIGYFKIEGIAGMPNNRLWFAVSEVACENQTPQFASILIEANYIETNGKTALNLITPFSIVADLGKQIEKSAGKNTGIAEIAFHVPTTQIFLLINLEVGLKGKNILDGHLFSMKLKEDGKLDIASLSVVKNLTKTSFNFGHKAKGMSFLGPELIIVTHGDSREKLIQTDTQDVGKWEFNESAYTVLRIAQPPSLPPPLVDFGSGSRIFENDIGPRSQQPTATKESKSSEK